MRSATSLHRPVALASDAARARLARTLTGRFWLRWHVALMLVGAFCTGFLVNAALLQVPLHSIVVRWVVRPTPATASECVPGAAQRRRQASPIAVHQTSGSCSAQPGWGETYGSTGTRPIPTTVPAGSNRIARTLCVPTSIARA